MDFVSREFKILNKKIRKYFDNFQHTFNKDMAALAKDLLVKNCKYLDASDFSEFKMSPFSLKSLENFVAESLKIHIKYLVAVRNLEKPSYSENVLVKIKTLNQLTFHLTIPSASQYNYANEIDINQASTELSSDNE
ncbi:6192_t:CDS:2 [Cetraspora pellucida]|uniref:6192_t:CDS:1 n=1 Tax=Cetraspora pellucida TaxID=1433469 RepID=A0A9N9P9X5_9GLOM|nr:6192_t:CDS:2 [Cetraspora pellucida]